MTETNKPTCYILIGLPGVGKSTWLQEAPEGWTVPRHWSGQVLSSDKIIEHIALAYDTTYDAIFSDAINLANKLFNMQLHESVKWAATTGYSRDIYIDRTNLTKSSRKRFVNMFRKTHKIVAVVFETPDDEEHERRLNSRHGKTIPAHVLKSMRESYDPPNPVDYDEIITIKA